MVSCKELRSVILQPWYKFCCRSPQIPISTGFKPGLFGEQWSGFSNRSYFLSFNISRVSLAVWAILRLGWINTHYVLSACSFQQSFSSTVHYNNTSHLPLYSVQQVLPAFNIATETITHFSYKERFISTQLQCRLTFSLISFICCLCVL